MAAHVMYWLACAVAVLCAVGSVIFLAVGLFYTVTGNPDVAAPYILILAPALLVISGGTYLSGHAVREMLARI